MEKEGLTDISGYLHDKEEKRMQLFMRTHT